MAKDKAGRAKIIVISGPSGAGKTTLLNKIFLKRNIRSSFIKGISYTTRPKRSGEKNGRDYYFVSKDKFLSLAESSFFLEHQKVLDD